LTKYYKEDDISDDACKDNLKIFEDAQLKITTESDKIIEGDRKANDNELEQVKEFLNEGEEINDADNDSQAIPDYWLKCFQHKNIYISEEDESILKNIKNLDIQTKNDDANKVKESTTLILKFKENEYFSNSELKVCINYKNDEPEKSVGSSIEWKEGKCPMEKKITKKQKSKKTGKTRTVEKTEKQRSFFDLFEDCVADEIEDLGLADEEGAAALDKMNVWEASDILESIMEVAPYSLEYYLDCNHEDEDMDDEEDDENIDIDENDEEDSEESPDVGPKKNKRKPSGGMKPKGGKSSKKASGNNINTDGAEPNDQECKQN